MDQNFALGRADLDAGYVLTCQSHPTSSDASPSTTTPGTTAAIPASSRTFLSSPLPDSNRRPLPYHGSALPTELRGRSPDSSERQAPSAQRCRTSSPSADPPVVISAGVTLKRGAGVGTVVPSCCTKPLRATLCGWRSASNKPSTGVEQASAGSKIAAHSSRVLVRKIVGEALLELRPASRSNCGNSSGRPRGGGAARRRTAARSRRPRCSSPSARLVDLVEVRAGVEQVGARAPRSTCRRRARPWISVASSDGAVDHRRVDDLALARALRLEHRADHAEGQQHPAAAEVADQVQRRQRPLAGASDRAEDAGERDVVDVVAGDRRERPVLAPAGHAAVDEPGLRAEAARRGRGRAAPSRRGGSPR